MQTSGSVSRRIAFCVVALQAKDFETVLIHYFPALDKTANRRYPREGVGRRIRKFLSDEEALISVLATGNLIKGIEVEGVDFPTAIYKFGRTPIAHEGELDPRLEITDSGTLEIGAKWSLPQSYLFGLIMAVVLAEENRSEHLADDVELILFDEKHSVNGLWGAAQRIRTQIAKDFGDPDLFES